MEFKVGQDIVYPKYGVGKILEIKSRKLPEGRTNFWRLTTLSCFTRVRIRVLTG